MPIGPYEDFGECVAAQKKKGKDDESAKKICGSLEKNAEVEERDGHLYLKAFLLDSSVNLNSWGVSKETLDQNINSFIAKPIVITENFDHPQSGDPNYDHHLQYQDAFRIGTIIDVVQKDGVYSAIAEITNPDAKTAFRSGNLPLYVSPQIFHDGVGKEPDNDARTWRGTHLAIVDEPAYGVMKARVSGQCNGDKDTCVAQLKKASCNFCIKRTIQKYVTNIKEASYSSLEKNRFNNFSKLSEVKEETISLEEFNKVKEANESLKKENAELKSLTTEKDNVISGLKQGNEDLTNRVAAIEKASRTEKIANVLSAVTFKTDEERNKRLDTLVNSNLEIDAIKETYEPLISATKSAAVTRLPQKNASSDDNPAWMTLGGYQ